MRRFLLLAAAVMWPATRIMAQGGGAGDPDEPGPFFNFLVNVVPWIVVFAIIWFFVFRILRGAQPHQQRLIQHMERVEQQYDRIIELLEKLVEKKQ